MENNRTLGKERFFHA